jgi:hypothetical protein
MRQQMIAENIKLASSDGQKGQMNCSVKESTMISIFPRFYREMAIESLYGD